MSNSFGHGGDWFSFQDESGQLPLDFSANISPLGVPYGVRAAICAAAEHADAYPDPECRELRAALSEHEGVPASQILCGAGAADLIWRAVLALRPRSACVMEPTFSEYRAALCAVGAEITPSLGPRTEMAFLCNPNNPAGELLSAASVRDYAARCRASGVVLLLDNCFLDFTDHPDPFPLEPGVLVLKAFTKLYGMAGIRLGYVMSTDEELLDRMAHMGPPWAVSTPAQAAGIAALKETDYVERVREIIREERPFLERELRSLGFLVVPGSANFLLFRSETPLEQPLRERGILIRNCGNIEGLDDKWYRTAVRTHEDNCRLIETLKEVIR